MLCLLSPAKTFQKHTNEWLPARTEPAFPAETNQLIKHLQEYNESGLAKLMYLSEKLADLNVSRYQNWANSEALPALFRYHGDVYKGLKYTSLSQKNWRHANAHIAILSGLYGVLRATDSIHEHRLEMGIKLPTDSGKNLYEFWDTKVTNQVNILAEKAGSDYILNLASNEYFKVIQPSKLTKSLITAQFLQIGPKGARNIAIHAKRARGLMARFVLDNKIKKPDQLLDFNLEDYEFSPDRSDNTTLIFTREKS